MTQDKEEREKCLDIYFILCTLFQKQQTEKLIICGFERE